MIFLNRKELELRRFPDGTPSFRIDPAIYGAGAVRSATIRWIYEAEMECMFVWHLAKHLHDHGIERISLEMPYIPNARQDRVQRERDVFTLRYFAEFINSMQFCEVVVFDPHSNVSTALIDRVRVVSAQPYIQQVIDDIGDPDLLMFYPDEGAAKRYSSMFKRPYAFGVKRRDWDSRKILGMEIISHEPVEGRNVLMVDDICSSGNTLYYSAKELAKCGAIDIYAYCSHCEIEVYEGKLLPFEHLKKFYTTNSFFMYSEETAQIDAPFAHPEAHKIHVLNWEV